MTDFATLAIKISTDGANRANNDLRSVERSSKQTEKAVDSLSLAINALKRLMALGIGIQGISGFLQMADTMQSLRTQVQFVTSSMAELNKVQQELFDISQRTRSSLESTTQLYVRTSRALKDYGVSQRQVLQFTETINKAMAVGGVGDQEQASALMQLSQALGSGRLQGDEFKTIAETAPIILDVVAEYMGKSREEVKKLASEGKITSKLLFEAINNSTQKINQQFEQMPLTFGQAMQQMENAALKFVGDLNQFTNATNGLAQGISFLAENFSVLATIVGGLMLAHLAKYGQSMAANIVTSYKQNLANLQLAQSAQVKAKSELGAAQANMTVLASELRLAQSEQTRSILRARMAQQSTLITSLKNAETVATNNLAAAQTRASIAGRALSGVMGLLGGPAGAITLAAGALFYFYQKAENARQAALDTADANSRLKESYEGMSEAVLTARAFEQMDILKEQKKQIENLTSAIRIYKEQQNDPELFSFFKKSDDEIAKMENNLKIMVENANTHTEVFKRQLNALGGAFIAEGKSLDDFRVKMEMMGASTEIVNDVLNSNEFKLSAVKSQIQALFPQIDATSISYDGLNLKIGNFSIVASEAQIKALNLSGAIGSIMKSALLATGAVSNLNGILGGEGAISDKAQKEIAQIKKRAEIADLKRQGKLKEARQKESELQAETMGYESGSVDFQAVVESLNALSTAQDSLQTHNKLIKQGEDHLKAWQAHYNELERANADSWTRIALEEERSIHEMLDKARKANVGFEEIERAKNLIYERYAKERQAIAEKYIPELKYKRELEEQLKEIQQLEKGNILNSQQANQARENVRWNSGEAIAKQAGQNAVSGYDRWKEQFDPMQAITNEQTAKTAELKSLYDQNLIQYQDFINAKAQIDAKATADTQNLFMESISGFGSAIDTMLGVMRNAGQEQSGIYKAMFAVSKAFAIADSIIKIQQGIANASSLPFPANLGAMATVASQTASIISTIQSTNLKGMAHSGIDNVPSEGTWLLDKGERVVDSRTNADLKTFLANQQKTANSGKSIVNVKIINNGQPVNAQVESNETADGVELTVTLLSKMNEVANNVYSKRQAQDMRPGGALHR